MASSWGLVGNGALWQAIVDMACLALSSKQCRYVRFLYGAGLAIGKYGEGGCTVRVLSGADVVPAMRAADGMDNTDSGGHGSILNERAKKVFPILGSMGKRLLYGDDNRLLLITACVKYWVRQTASIAGLVALRVAQPLSRALPF